MKISVCIPTFKRPVSLLTVLTRLLGEVSNFDELLIGITKDSEDSIGAVESSLNQVLEGFRISGVTVEVKSGLTGLIDAKMWFKERASNDLLLIIDDDAVIGEGYFDLVKHFQDSQVGAVSGVLQTPVNVGGYRDWSAEEIKVEGNKSNTLEYDSNKKTIVWKDKWQVYMHTSRKVFDCEYLIGTALFVRKDILELDMAFQHGACGGEEIDFTYSIYKKGFRLLFDSGRICWHLHEDKGGTREFDRKDDQKNFDYLVKKWNLGDGVVDACSHYE